MSFDTRVKELITRHGPISVDRYMQMALTDRDQGYYLAQQPFGQDGDFITAPEISQVFGELVGLWCAVFWQQQLDSGPVTLMEFGPGRGTLMQDLLRGTQHIEGFHDALTIVMVEVSPALSALQKQVLQDLHPRVSWQTDVSSFTDGPILVVANEFLDALPIKQYVHEKDGWHEHQVVLVEDRLAFGISEVLSLSKHLAAQYPDAKNAAVVEVCPAALSVVQQISQHIETHRGAALFIDYGYTTPPFASSLQAVKDHQYHSIFENVGEADLSAHVDFSALAQASPAPSGLVTQRDFLLAMGIEERTKALLQHADAAQRKLLKTGTERLISTAQMGSLFKAFALWHPDLNPPIGFSL